MSRSVAERLALPSVGKRPVGTAGGLILVDRYPFRIGFTTTGAFPFIFDEIAGFELVEMTNFDAMLGMDVLRRCDFEMRRDGMCVLRFA